MSGFKVGDRVVHKTWPSAYLGILLHPTKTWSGSEGWMVDWSFTNNPEAAHVVCPYSEADLASAIPLTPEEIRKCKQVIEQAKDALRTPIERRVRKSWNASNYVKKHPEQAY